MRRIRLLPEGLVNRIAAGEVVERPAAAVKELVENALDAGATPDRGQRSRAAASTGSRWSTTGAAWTRDDLALAVQRHCTSKLDDEALVRITTLGFRGEALPSIGAAARLHLVSRPHGARARARDPRSRAAGSARSAPAAGAAGHPRGGDRPVLRHPGAAQVPQAAPHRGRARRGWRCAAWRWPRPRSRSASRATAGSRSTCRRRTARRGSRRCSAPDAAGAAAGRRRSAATLRLTGFAAPADGDAGLGRRSRAWW